MGATHSVPLYVADSIVNPGNPSIVSDPIEADFDAYCDELVKYLRYPVDPTIEAVLKTCAVTEGATPDDFEVKVILDPVKLQSVGYANEKDPSLERIHVHRKFHLDRAGRWLTDETYEPCWAGEEPKLVLKARADFTKDPLRLDYFWTMANGDRKADETTLAVLKPVSDLVLASLADRKVTMTFDAAKKAATSGPIDEAVVTYEALFDAIVACQRETPKTAVEDISDNKFKIRAQDDEAQVPYNVVTVEKEQGILTNDLFQADGTKKLSTTTFTFTKSPLSLEVKVECEGEIVTGVGSTRLMQALVDSAVAKATKSGWGLGIF